MLVHIKTEVIVHLGRLDEANNVRQSSEFKFLLADHSDGAFLELAQAVRSSRAELAAELAKG